MQITGSKNVPSRHCLSVFNTLILISHRFFVCFFMVFRWGHSRSRALPFYLKIKTWGFHMKTPTCLKFRPFQNVRLEIARVRGGGSKISPSLSHSHTLAFLSLVFFKTSIFQTLLRFSCGNLAFLFLNKKVRLEWPHRTP